MRWSEEEMKSDRFKREERKKEGWKKRAGDRWRINTYIFSQR